MPIFLNWDNSTHDRILFECQPPITWNEFEEKVHQAHIMIESERRRVDLLIWANGDLPDGFALPHFRKAFDNQPANFGSVFIVTPEKRSITMLLQRFASIMNNALSVKNKINFYASLDDARQASAHPAAS
jgi:hypothetical protein